MDKQIQVNGRKFKVRELLNSEAQTIVRPTEVNTPEEKIKIDKEATKQETIFCAGITSEEYDGLTYKEWLTLRRAILELNTPSEDFWVAN